MPAPLPNVVSSIIRELETDSTLVVVGCGRMLDALIKYGGFPISRVNYFIDNFIGQATDQLYNRTLYLFENFSAPETNLHFLVVARTSNVELMKEIGERFPDARVTFVSELI
jgi:hypothetical protein